MLPYPGVGVGVGGVFFWEVIPDWSVVDAHPADKSARTSRQMRGALYRMNSILVFSWFKDYYSAPGVRSLFRFFGGEAERWLRSRGALGVLLEVALRNS